MTPLEGAAHIALDVLVAQLEAPPLRHIPVTRVGNVSAITKALRGADHDALVRFAQSKSRSAMLAASRNYLNGLDDHEEIIVALGKRHGNGARFDGFWLGRGVRSRVAFTPMALHSIEGHLRVASAEILVIHNHPPNDVKSLLEFMFGWRPTASAQDRDVALRANSHVWQLHLGSASAPTLRWYLVDQGEIAEFYLPSLRHIGALVAKLGP